jgi:hypothetical protein
MGKGRPTCIAKCIASCDLLRSGVARACCPRLLNPRSLPKLLRSKVLRRPVPSAVIELQIPILRQIAPYTDFLNLLYVRVKDVVLINKLI